MNTTSQPVVVGIAGEQPAVVRWAVVEAERLGRPLRVVHTWVMAAMEAEAYVMSDTTTIMRVEAERVLDESRALVEALAPALEAEYVVEYGAPDQILIQESASAASVIVGSDDASWIGRLLGGERSAHLGRSGHCPVVVVPQRLALGTGAGGVVVAVDGETSASGPLQYALEQADSRGVPVLVLHSVPPWTRRTDFTDHQVDLSEIVAGWQEQFPGVEIDRTMVEGDTIEECIDATGQAALLVLGRHHGRSGPSDLLHPVAAAVLRGAQCPVALVPLEVP